MEDCSEQTAEEERRLKEKQDMEERQRATMTEVAHLSLTEQYQQHLQQQVRIKGLVLSMRWRCVRH